MIQVTFIILEPCRFDKVRGLESHFFLIILITNKYLLHNIKRETDIPYKILMTMKIYIVIS
jgi:hypothetical protein